MSACSWLERFKLITNKSSVYSCSVQIEYESLTPLYEQLVSIHFQSNFALHGCDYVSKFLHLDVSLIAALNLGPAHAA